MAGKPVFSTRQIHNGSFKAQNLKVAIGDRPVDGMGLQNTQFQFQQQISMIYELPGGGAADGANNGTPGSYVYLVGGRAQGSASISRIIGPAALQALVIESYGDICSPKDLRFDASSGFCARQRGQVGAGGAGGLVYELKDAIMQGVSGGISAQDLMITENLALMFLDLLYEVK